MYHYDPQVARLRDMILRTKLEPTSALELNRVFQDYLAGFGELQKMARGILENLATGSRKGSSA
jgi:hypothetical protein